MNLMKITFNKSDVKSMCDSIHRKSKTDNMHEFIMHLMHDNMH